MGMIDPKDWNRQPDNGESFRAYEAFLMYRDQGPIRAIKVAAYAYSQASPIATRTVENWASKNKWESRANAYDVHTRKTQSLHIAKVQDLNIDEWIARRRDHMEREHRVGNLLMDKAERLAETTSLPRDLKDAAAVCKVASEMLWRLYGMALPVEAEHDEFDVEGADKEALVAFIKGQAGARPTSPD